MNRTVLLLVSLIVLFGCGNQKAQKHVEDVAADEVVTLSVDELYKSATDLADKEIVVKGTVMHVCQHGGQRCFIMGSNEDINIRIEAGEKIGAFDQKLMGSEIEVVGIFKEVKTEAEAHNPGQHEHGDGEHKEDTETENAHKIIAEAQEAMEVVYYIEGIKSKEL